MVHCMRPATRTWSHRPQHRRGLAALHPLKRHIHPRRQLLEQGRPRRQVSAHACRPCCSRRPRRRLHRLARQLRAALGSEGKVGNSWQLARRHRKLDGIQRRNRLQRAAAQRKGGRRQRAAGRPRRQAHAAEEACGAGRQVAHARWDSCQGSAVPAVGAHSGNTLQAAPVDSRATASSSMSEADTGAQPRHLSAATSCACVGQPAPAGRPLRDTRGVYQLCGGGASGSTSRPVRSLHSCGSTGVGGRRAVLVVTSAAAAGPEPGRCRPSQVAPTSSRTMPAGMMSRPGGSTPKQRSSVRSWGHALPFMAHARLSMAACSQRCPPTWAHKLDQLLNLLAALLGDVRYSQHIHHGALVCAQHSRGLAQLAGQLGGRGKLRRGRRRRLGGGAGRARPLRGPSGARRCHPRHELRCMPGCCGAAGSSREPCNCEGAHGAGCWRGCSPPAPMQW